jgi:hypothetical protein
MAEEYKLTESNKEVIKSLKHQFCDKINEKDERESCYSFVRLLKQKPSIFNVVNKDTPNNIREQVEKYNKCIEQVNLITKITETRTCPNEKFALNTLASLGHTNCVLNELTFSPEDLK